MVDRIWICHKLFKDSYSNLQQSSKLSARRFGPFTILELVGRNTVRLQIPSHIRIHAVVRVSHTKSHREQPAGFAQKVQSTRVPVDGTAASFLFEFDRILAHRRRGRWYQWLKFRKDSSTHEAQWQQTRAFVDNDGTLTDAFRNYIVRN